DRCVAPQSTDVSGCSHAAQCRWTPSSADVNRLRAVEECAGVGSGRVKTREGGRMHAVLVVGSAFLASLVEMVEALTIVLAVGVTRGWRSAIWGVLAAVAALAVVVAALGPALASLPLDSLRVLIGGLLLVFGLQWLRKAILRASGLKALHDEDAIY